MRHILYNISYACLFAVIFLCACSDSEDIRPNVDRYVRINQSSITINVGEEYLIKPSVDTLSGKGYNLIWTLGDGSLATINKTDDQSGLLKGVKAGKTTIKVETADHQLMYFTDLNVIDGSPAIKLLTIGSGTADMSANEILVNVANAAGKRLVVCNIYEDKASLGSHIKNIDEELSPYIYRRIDEQLNINNQRDMSLRDVVGKENWDYIAIEESVDSAGIKEGYSKHLPELIDKIKKWSTNPNMKVILHQPWAYSSGAQSQGFLTYGSNQMTMFEAIGDATKAAASQVSKVVPVGTAIQNARTSYLGESVINGDIDLNASSGKFIAALTWIETLFDIDVTQSPLSFPELSEYVNSLYKAAAHNAVKQPNAVTDLVDFKSANSFQLACPIIIDFGKVETPHPYNSFLAWNAPVNNLIDFNGNETFFNIEATTEFNNVIARREITNTLGLPESVCQDMFFRDGNAAGQGKGGLRLTNMNSSMRYSFYIYASINDRNTGTHFKFAGVNTSEIDVVNDFNTDRYDIVTGIQPTSNGTIDIELTKAPFNTHWAGFFGINALIIVPEGYDFEY